MSSSVSGINPHSLRTVHTDGEYKSHENIIEIGFLAHAPPLTCISQKKTHTRPYVLHISFAHFGYAEHYDFEHSNTYPFTIKRFPSVVRMPRRTGSLPSGCLLY